MWQAGLCSRLRIGNSGTLWCSQDGDLLSKMCQITRVLRLGLSIAILIIVVSSSDLSAVCHTPDGFDLAQLDEGTRSCMASPLELLLLY